MRGHWDCYLSDMNGKRASTFLNLDWGANGPDPQQTWLLVAELQLLKARPQDGLSSQDEFDTLMAIESTLEELVSTHHDGQHVGSVTTNGTRTFYYYAAHADHFAESVKEVMVKHVGYRVRAGAKEDPGWRKYFDDLFPDDLQKQEMDDRRVLEVLLESGDAGDKVRPVDHFSFFKTAAARDDFKKVSIAAGFEVAQEYEIDPEDASEGPGVDTPFALQYVRSQALVGGAISETTSFLWKLSREHGGNYDGWETPVVTKPWWKFWA